VSRCGQQLFCPALVKNSGAIEATHKSADPDVSDPSKGHFQSRVRPLCTVARREVGPLPVFTCEASGSDVSTGPSQSACHRTSRPDQNGFLGICSVQTLLPVFRELRKCAIYARIAYAGITTGAFLEPSRTRLSIGGSPKTLEQPLGLERRLAGASQSKAIAEQRGKAEAV